MPPARVLARIDHVKGTVRLGWDPPPGSVGFNVYRSMCAGGNWDLVSSVKVPEYRDAGLERERTDCYAVTSLLENFEESPRSDQVEVKVIRLAE